jgi:histone H3/H4
VLEMVSPRFASQKPRPHAYLDPRRRSSTNHSQADCIRRSARSTALLTRTPPHPTGPQSPLVSLLNITPFPRPLPIHHTAHTAAYKNSQFIRDREALASLAAKMSGRGKVGKGLGKGGAKRHRKVLRDNIQGITKPAIRRLTRRGGVKRISGLIYKETRGVLKIFLENVIRDSVTYTEHARRKTVTATSSTLYGFGG